MELDSLRDLLTPSGQQILQAASDLSPREEDFLGHFTHLSRRFPADLARAALEIAILRREAGRKFPFADQLYLTRQALEQASSWEVSSYRAGRYEGYPFLVDLGCSIGGDTFALAKIAPVLGVDLDPLRLGMAKANLAGLGLDRLAWVCQADITNPLPLSHAPVLPASPALFFDPSRRSGHRRIHSVRAYQPPLEVLREWLPVFPALGVKISPGVDLEELEGYDAEVEFISLHGELKEAVLWFGPMKTTHRRATLLPGPHSIFSNLDSRTSPLPYRLPLSNPLTYLYEPDPAVFRAGLLAELGARLGAAQLDPDIAYLTADRRQETPYARLWAVEAWFPFQLKRLRAYLRERHVGRVTVKKRGSPLEPEELTGKLRLSGDAERTVFLTHLRGEPVVIVSSS
jgi:SAM-dependent methyltransferase